MSISTQRYPFITRLVDSKLISKAKSILPEPHFIITFNFSDSALTELHHHYPKSQIQNLEFLSGDNFNSDGIVNKIVNKIDLILANFSVTENFNPAHFFNSISHIININGLFIFAAFDNQSKSLLTTYLQEIQHQTVVDDLPFTKYLKESYLFKFNSFKENLIESDNKHQPIDCDIFVVTKTVDNPLLLTNLDWIEGEKGDESLNDSLVTGSDELDKGELELRENEEIEFENDETEIESIENDNDEKNEFDETAEKLENAEEKFELEENKELECEVQEMETSESLENENREDIEEQEMPETESKEDVEFETESAHETDIEKTIENNEVEVDDKDEDIDEVIEEEMKEEMKEEMESEKVVEGEDENVENEKLDQHETEDSFKEITEKLESKELHSHDKKERSEDYLGYNEEGYLEDHDINYEKILNKYMTLIQVQAKKISQHLSSSATVLAQFNNTSKIQNDKKSKNEQNHKQKAYMDNVHIELIKQYKQLQNKYKTVLDTFIQSQQKTLENSIKTSDHYHEFLNHHRKIFETAVKECSHDIPPELAHS